MKSTFHNLRVDNCGVGISMSSGGEGDVFINTQINHCDVAIEYRDPPSFLESIGLPPNTPSDAVIESLNILKAHEKSDNAHKMALIKRSRLGSFIEGSVNATSIIANLISISAQPQIAAIIASLKNVNI
ncbi:hypothetical protein [Pseudomonas tussilaginis]|uniref:hypothetical protein n=1 Tax=Pseudomonas putida TaxID=303 RepID=UPI0023633D85|nr:hypothetical protein [Pseudomonas putida]MDD1977105.1 hypothetical protein [Pseudomonas putida]